MLIKIGDEYNLNKKEKKLFNNKSEQKAENLMPLTPMD
jgi:hypothetical protein